MNSWWWTGLVGVVLGVVGAARGGDGAGGRLRVGMVGLVHGHAHQFFRSYKAHPEIELVGVAEGDAGLRGQYGKQYSIDGSLMYSSLEEMLEKARPGAVVVYTDTLDHRKVVEACARRGVDVMMEKPLAVSIEDGRAIAAAAKAGKIHVIVNYETTWYRSNQLVGKMVRSGELGEVRKIVAHDGHRGPKEIGVGPEFLGWLEDPEKNGGGALFDFGCYGADLATWLMDGARPGSVTCVEQRIKPEVYAKVEDEATVVVTYPKAQGIFQASWNWPYNRKDLEVYGTKGYAITVGADRVRVWHVGEKELEEKVVEAPALAGPYDSPLSYLKAVVMDGAKEEGLGDLGTNLVVTEILDRAREAGREGRTVKGDDGRGAGDR